MSAPRDIVCTVPKSLRRDLLMRQLHGCNGRIAWHLCVNKLPKQKPARLHFVHDGFVIGWMPVLDMAVWDGRDLRRADGTPLSTKGRKFAIRASGEFTAHRPPMPMRGFQGWRYYDATAHSHQSKSGCRECGGFESIWSGNDFIPCPRCRTEAVT